MIWALPNRFPFVLSALAVGCVAACGSGASTPAPTASVTSSASSSTLSTTATSTFASSTKTITKKFELAIVGPIHAGDIFQLELTPPYEGQTLFEFCGQTGPCVSGRPITRTFGNMPYGIAAPWKFEKTTGPNGPITVFKLGTDPMTSDSTITATYAYQ